GRSGPAALHAGVREARRALAGRRVAVDQAAVAGRRARIPAGETKHGRIEGSGKERARAADPPRARCRELPARLAPAGPEAAAGEPAASAAATGARLTRTRLVDRDRPAAELRVVQRAGRLLRLVVRAHLHEPEPARAARGHVTDHLRALDRPILAEQGGQLLL